MTIQAGHETESEVGWCIDQAGHEIENEAVFSAIDSVSYFEPWFFVSPNLDLLLLSLSALAKVIPQFPLHHSQKALSKTSQSPEGLGSAVLARRR